MSDRSRGENRGIRTARLPPVSEARAKYLADLFAETFDLAETAIAVFETAGAGWVAEILFRQPPDEDAFRAVVASIADQQAAAALTFATIADKDWVAASIAGLNPVEAGRFVVHGRHDRPRVPANRIGIEIEAALAFGTGHHGTTRACILALDTIVKSRRPARILDIGTGTGVLAIAAAKALRSPVLANDIDRLAVTVARENARANHVGTCVRVVHAAGVTTDRVRERGPFGLVFANILLAPLRAFAVPLAALLAPGAHVVLSGLLPSQANAALAAYRARGLILERRMLLDGWVTLVMRANASLRRNDGAPDAGLSLHPGGAKRRRRQRTKGSASSFLRSSRLAARSSSSGIRFRYRAISRCAWRIRDS